MGHDSNTRELTEPQQEILRFLRNGGQLIRTADVPPRYGFQFAAHLRQVSPTSVLKLVTGGWIEEGKRGAYRLTATALAELAPRRRKAAAV